MKKLNKQWRQKDYATDVLSFPMQGSGVGESDEKPLLGDVVVNADAAKRQANELHVSFTEEMIRLLVHGIVHLKGYDHELGRSESAKMRAMERKIIKDILQDEKLKIDKTP